MALIAIASANGSPGTTTTALGLALSWPRPVVLVDADPTGARAVPAGYLRGGELPNPKTLVDLAVSLRQGSLIEDLPRSVFTLPGSQVQLLTGPLNHTQAQALDSLWEPLAAALKALERNGQDVIVDIGRLGLQGSAYKLLTAADLAFLATRTTLPALVAASSWAQTLRGTFEQAGARSSLAALVIGEGRPYGAGEAAKVLQMPVTARLAWDPEAAAVYSDGATPPRKFAAAALNKSLRAAVQAIQSTLASARAELGLAADRSQ
ncbi:hypothetical protein Xcel_3418 (plasmid) [Xylanimonas cellulosilytica DSM 15894]|uniref:ATPase involved in chromosome partitioning-like protein n=1 Tax=Xylanimonas cellulosilytica (strain DSM 15894 / JCM 12276 / CECT 5975 / KCTC 9989 / LMG 20990 / NBRC 107835 / XIL07) TaxID=446471 RepID=D1C0V1_XYLCX|nr:hypothetical protein [Xylanimonas cellulosilytica]ACZ32417.1 hypothetical protein Xcel_3418 [Xylanimonas cellulosilytica DSM 15894]